MKIYKNGLLVRDDLPQDSSKSPIFKLGTSRPGLTSSDLFVQALKNALDHRFSMLCVVQLEEANDILSLVLVGPTGIWVILPCDDKGVFQVNETSWDGLNSRTGEYKPVKPNPIQIVVSQVEALARKLSSQGLEHLPLEPVVYFSDPGAHVHSNRPSARIVLVDGLERFINSVWMAPVAMDGDTVQLVVTELLGEPSQTPPVLAGEVRDAYSLQEVPEPKKPAEPSRLAQLSREEPGIIKRLSRHFAFTRQQWLLLWILLVVTLMILVWLVVVVVIIT